MSSNEANTEDLLDRLILEVKAIALLYSSDAELKQRLAGKVTDSHDEGVRRFVKALQGETHTETGRLFAIAVGELVMAALLVVAGTVALVPTVAGINSLEGFVQYFAERAVGVVEGSPFSSYLSPLEFVLGVALVLSAFFALHEAAKNLKRAGLAVKSGEG